MKWFNVQLVITKGRANALVVWPCVSSVDQSSCLRQTGCNQACHIDHHQALLHHRRSIHHCIGGAGHSLVTDPPPQNSTNPRTLERRSKIRILLLFAMTIWRMSGHQRVWLGLAVGGVTVPRNDKQGVTFQLSRPQPPTPRSAPNLFCCPFDLGLCPVVTFDNSQAENCVLSFSNCRPYACTRPL